MPTTLIIEKRVDVTEDVVLCIVEWVTEAAAGLAASPRCSPIQGKANKAAAFKRFVPLGAPKDGK